MATHKPTLSQLSTGSTSEAPHSLPLSPAATATGMDGGHPTPRYAMVPTDQLHIAPGSSVRFVAAPPRTTTGVASEESSGFITRSIGGSTMIGSGDEGSEHDDENEVSTRHHLQPAFVTAGGRYHGGSMMRPSQQYDNSIILLDDPALYRPAPGILDWKGPKRSLKPPKMQLWLVVAVIQTIQMVVLATVPGALPDENRTVFVAVWIAVCAIFCVAVSYMSTTRHLHKLTELMNQIDEPAAMDRVVEDLQEGRFSRFEETWKVQVSLIKMFCRLLKYHHTGGGSGGGTFRTMSAHHHQSHAATNVGWSRENLDHRHGAPERKRTIRWEGEVGTVDEEGETVPGAGGALPHDTDFSTALAATPRVGPELLYDDDLYSIAGDSEGEGYLTPKCVAITVHAEGTKTPSFNLGSSSTGGGRGNSPRHFGHQPPPAPMSTTSILPDPTPSRGGSSNGGTPIVPTSVVNSSDPTPSPNQGVDAPTAGGRTFSTSGGDSFTEAPTPHQQVKRRVSRRGSTAASGTDNSDGLPRPSPVWPQKDGRRRSRVALDGDPLQDNKIDWSTALGPDSDDSKSRGLMLQVLKGVKLGQDLSKTPLPVDILEPRSLLEKLSDLFVHPRLLGLIANEKDPGLRAVALCRWFVSGFHVRPKGPRKPYNPILGETFDCVFAPGTPDETRYIAEQVSHHPPASNLVACHIRTGTKVVASFWPKSKLVSPNTGASIGDGRITVFVPAQNDSYELTWPSAHISGLLKAPARIEVVGEVKITAKNSGVTGCVEFKQKGWFKGEYDELGGYICPRGGTPKQPTHTFNGIWHSLTQVNQVDHTGQVVGTETLFNSSSEEPLRPFVGETYFKKPSRAIWTHVTTALRNKDAKAAQKQKEELEENERQVRRAREARGEEYLPQLFRMVDKPKKAPQATWQYIGPKFELLGIGGKSIGTPTAPAGSSLTTGPRTPTSISPAPAAGGEGMGSRNQSFESAPPPPMSTFKFPAE